MKRILVPIDFSKQAEAAAKTAVNIAKKTSSEIHLLHMLELPVEMADPTGLGNISGPSALFFMEQTKIRFEKFCAQPMFEGITVVQNLQFAKTFSGILEGAKKNDIDLIVMGSKGTTGLGEMLIGSNTEKVVRLSEIPVLVVKDTQEEFSPKHIVFASDFKQESIPSLKRLVVLNEIFDAQIHLLKVNTINNFETTKESGEKMEAFLLKAEMDFDDIHFYNDQSIEEGILNFSNDIDADLIALTTHGRRGISHLFNGSIGEDLANHALKPVITFKV
ncbi:MAG: universal stress protein [Flavobacteriaceae bacterium]